MTGYTRVRLAPQGPFHFGGRGVGMEHSEVGLPADSLFSALCMALSENAGSAAVEDLLARFLRAKTPAEAPFRLASLMPYAAGVCFLPYPMIDAPKVKGAGDPRQRKRFKEIAWVSEAVFHQLACGVRPADAVDGDDRPLTIHGGEIWLTQAEDAKLAVFKPHNLQTDASEAKPVLWRTGTRPRVAVDRVASASAVYSTGATEFNRAEVDGQRVTAGLYTIIEWLHADSALRGQIEAALVTLGASGIGGERSSGHGQFDPSFEKLEAWAPGAAAGSFFATLSPYHPHAGEKAVIAAGAHYEIVLRRGWLSLPGYQNLRRASVRMIADGSVLPWPAGAEPFGELADVTPKRLLDETGRHVYRYGLAFPVRIADAAMAGEVTHDRP